MGDFASSGAAVAARTMKAVALEETCRNRGLLAAQVATMDTNNRRFIEREAGTRVASDATWAMVVRFMEDWEANRQGDA